MEKKPTKSDDDCFFFYFLANTLNRIAFSSQMPLP